MPDRKPGVAAPRRRKKPLLTRHVYQHHRFYLGAGAAAIAIGLTWGQNFAVQAIAAGDAFFAVYLVLIALFASRSTPQSAMEHAREEDEGLLLIAGLTAAAVGCSLTGIVTLLGDTGALNGWIAVAAAISVPLGWLTVHTSVALHYARLYYAEEEGGESAKGLEFPCDEEPDIWDFLYFSFVLGMTAQTSDIQITGRRMRRSVLAHSVISFFYNTVIVALTVNVAVQIAG